MSSFKILKGASRTGSISVKGYGYSSQLLCDTTVLTVNGGSGSVIDNFQMMNITPPWIITRDPAKWSASVESTLRRSNDEGYQPTINDGDIWPKLNKEQQEQQVGPTILMRGNATNISVSRIYGRFVVIGLYDAQYSSVCDCSIRGGKGGAAAIFFWNINDQVGRFNRAMRNTVSYSSFSGIAFSRNFDFQAHDNMCVFEGESGVKTWQGIVAGKDSHCFRGQIQNNVCKLNYFDGVDAMSEATSDDSILTYHQVQGNYCLGNGGDGINSNGQFNQITDNYLASNGRYGLWGAGLSLSKISGNVCIDNNQSRKAFQHDLSIDGVKANNAITDNWVWAGAGQNNYGIYAPGSNFVNGNFAVNGARFFFGQSRTGGTSQNDKEGGVRHQSFTLAFTTHDGEIKNSFQRPGQRNSLSDAFDAHGASYERTPFGPDATTTMANGGKIASETPNVYWLDFGDQDIDAEMLIAQVSYNDTGKHVCVHAEICPTNMDGVVSRRVALLFTISGSGAPFELNAANVPEGKTVKVQFMGKLS